MHTRQQATTVFYYKIVSELRWNSSLWCLACFNYRWFIFAEVTSREIYNDLITHLMTGYNSNARPVYSASTTTNVVIYLDIYRIIQLVSDCRSDFVPIV